MMGLQLANRPYHASTQTLNNTIITQINAPLIDSQSNVWTITGGHQVSFNGVVISATSSVDQILYVKGVVWQHNTFGNYYSFVVTNGVPGTGVGPQTTTPIETITGIILSSNTFTGGTASNTVIGTISVTTSGPAFAGNLSLSGANSASFKIVGINFETNGIVNNGNYAVNIIADDPGSIATPFTQSEIIVGSSAGLTAPSQALTAGFNTLVFGPDFTSASDVATTSGQSTGAKLYWAPLCTPSVTVNTGIGSGNTAGANGILTINSWTGTSFGPNLATTPPNANSSTTIGCWNHGYFEARVQFAATVAGSGAPGGIQEPSFWLKDTRNLTAGTYHFAEADIMEYFPNGTAGSTANYISTLHNWFDNAGSFSDQFNTNSTNFDSVHQPHDSAWHTYGMLWTGNGITGQLSFYYDNILCTHQSGTQFYNLNINGTPTAALTAMENAQMAIQISSAASGWPVNFDWIRVWQTGPSGGLALSSNTFSGITGTNFFIDPSMGGASDSNNGTSPATPWLTLAKLNATFTAGDTIFVRAGSSFSSAGTTATIPAVGTTASPVRITRFGTGVNPIVLTTSAAIASVAAIKLTSVAQHVILDSMKVTRADHSYGIWLNGSDNCAVQFCEVSACGEGIIMDNNSDRDLIAANFVHDLVMIVNDSTPNNDTGAQGINTSGAATNIEVAFNYLLNCKATSIDYGFDGGGMETWQNVNGLNVHDNFADNCDGFLECGGSVNTQLVQNVTIANNVIKNCGLVSWLHDSTGTFGITPSNVAFNYNTIYNANATNVLWGAETSMPSTVTSSHNLILSTGSNAVYFTQDSTAVGIVHTNNFYQVGTRPTGTGETGGTITFTNIATDNFHTSGNAASYGAYANGGNPSAVWPNPAYVVPNGVTIGTISGFTGTLTIGGTYSSLFQIVGAVLSTKGPVTKGTYDITITDSGTGLTQTFIITGQ